MQAPLTSLPTLPELKAQKVDVGPLGPVLNDDELDLLDEQIAADEVAANWDAETAETVALSLDVVPSVADLPPMPPGPSTSASSTDDVVPIVPAPKADTHGGARGRGRGKGRGRRGRGRG